MGFSFRLSFHGEEAKAQQPTGPWVSYSSSEKCNQLTVKMLQEYE